MTDEAVLDGQRHIWTIGDYPAIARRLLPISVDVVETLKIETGRRVLDVGVGDGNTAIEAARRGASVTGVDLTPAQIHKARARAVAEGLNLELYEANAEDLPLDDASFDDVVSVMGMIFAPDHRRAARELARVCRPGGQVAITAWADEGWFRAWRDRALPLIPPPPPGGPDPDAWGRLDVLRQRLTDGGLEVEAQTRPFVWDFASVDESLEFFTTNAGPFIAFMEHVAGLGKADEARAMLREVIEETNVADDGTVRLDAPYLLAVGRR